MSTELKALPHVFLKELPSAPDEYDELSRGAEWYESCKSVLDFSAACVLLVLTAPAVLLAAVLIKLTSRGPAFYTQVRLGLHRRPYTIYKLRTMRDNCERASGPCWSLDGDPRVTLVGRVLRRLHIDELPQLWNVLRGEMRLVGPRPERPEFLPELSRAVPLYCSRLHVRPGVTGLAQVQLPADTDLASVRRKIVYDLHYVLHRNFWLDLRILLATGLKLLGVSFPRIQRLAFLPRKESLVYTYRQQLKKTRLFGARRG
jgi:lipopolysaccharide/colanic/teichoic acid biosynthesis glycosyltransferase